VAVRSNPENFDHAARGFVARDKANQRAADTAGNGWLMH
jgi:hypothetical protein